MKYTRIVKYNAKLVLFVNFKMLNDASDFFLNKFRRFSLSLTARKISDFLFQV